MSDTPARLDTLARYKRVLSSNPTEVLFRKAEQVARESGEHFRSAEEVLLAASVLTQIHLAKGSLGCFGCTKPTSCAEASMVYGWLHREPKERFAIPQHLRPLVLLGVKTWPAQSEGCECAHSYLVRKANLENAGEECNKQCLRLQEENYEVFGENMLEAVGP